MKPAVSLFISIFILAALAAVAIVLDIFIYAWAVWLLVVLVLAGIDALLYIAMRQVKSDRRFIPSMALGVPQKIGLKITYEGAFPTRLLVYDHYPPGVEISGLPAAHSFKKDTLVIIQYHVTPQERGDIVFGQTELLMRSPLGFWYRSVYSGEKQVAQVYPNFTPILSYTLLAAENRLNQLGVVHKRKRGEGIDFYQLREYREGDTMRQIDWKATSRLKKLISREYREEKDQQIMFLLDCGRRMRSQDGSLSHFDHTLNALLLMTYVALHQGDAVGLMTWPDQNFHLAPRGGKHAFNSFLNTVYRLKTRPEGIDYIDMARSFMERKPKRSLVVLLSNLRDEEEEDIMTAVELLRKKHFLILASLGEESLYDSMDRDVHSMQDAVYYAAAARYLEHRRNLYTKLMKHRIAMIDTTPAKLPIQLVNKYLEIKKAQKL